MNKARINFWLDVGIGIAFLFSAVSGLVFLLPVNLAEILGINYRSWSDLHTWSSLVMIVGVVAHLALHWKWIVAMTRRTLRTPKRPAVTAPAPVLALDKSRGRKMNRREFLYLGGVATAATAFIAAGYKVISAPESAETSGDVLTETSGDVPTGTSGGAPTETSGDVSTGTSEDVPGDRLQPEAAIEPTPQAIEPTPQAAGVACPFGVVDDPYPGRCRRYTDANGDGICDYSVPGSAGQRGFK